MKKLIVSTLCVVGFLLVWSGIAPAADVPGTVQPGQIERQFQPEPKVRAGQPDRIGVPELDQPVPSEAKGIRFTLTKILIEGATVYSESELLAPYQGHVGTEVLLSDIYQIAAFLTVKYRNDGYILSRVIVPVQTIERGEVRLKAVEGYVSKVTIEGGGGDWRKLVDRYAEEIKKSRPLRSDVLERSMMLMNDLPGAFARATIKPSHTEPGTAELIVHFSQSKLQGGLSMDNRGGESLGPMRMSADVALNNILGLQDSTILRVVGSSNDRMKFASLVHEERIGSDGGKVWLFGSMVRAEPKEMAFIPLNLETSSETYGIAGSYPFIRSRTQNLSVRLSVYAHDGKTEIFGVEDTRDRIRGVRLGVTYDKADSWNGINLLDIEVSQGIDGLGSSDNGDMMLSRPNGRVDFTKATLYAARLQSLSARWSLLAAVNGQYAWSDLLSSELYSFGGEQFGRGYDPSELVGDHGVAGKFELRFTDTLNVGFVSSYTAYGFYDVGVVYQRTSGGSEDHESAASAGLGLRFNLGQYASCYFEMAQPLTRDVSAEGSRHKRFYAGASLRF